MVGAALLAYLLTQRLAGSPILPAFVAGILVAAVTGQLGAFPSTFALPGLDVVRPGALLDGDRDGDAGAGGPDHRPVQHPVDDLHARSGLRPAGADRVRGQRGRHDRRVVLQAGRRIARAAARPADRGAGRGRAVDPLSLGLPPDRRRPRDRAVREHRGDLAVLVPSVLLLSMAGLALIGALIAALKEIAARPLTLGPVVLRSRSRCPT